MGTIHVVHLIEALEVGGVETNLASLLKRIRKGGFVLEVWCLLVEGTVAAWMKREGIPVRSLGGKRNHTFFNIWRTYRALKHARPLILHCHDFPAGVIGRIAGILAGVPVLFSHFYAPREPSEVPSRDRWIESLLLRRTERIFAGSLAVRENIASLYDLPIDKIELVYNCVESDLLSHPSDVLTVRAELGIKEGSFVITDISRLVPHKGHRVLFEAISRLVSQRQNLMVLLVGEGPERPALEAEAKRLGLNGIVRFLGFREDLSNILALSDLVVLPSFREGFGIVLAEAGLFGKPVVATRTGGAKEVVLHGKTGFLVEPGDISALAEAIQTFLDHPELREVFGREGKAFCQENFLPDRWASVLEGIYRKAVSDRLSRTGEG